MVPTQPHKSQFSINLMSHSCYKTGVDDKALLNNLQNSQYS